MDKTRIAGRISIVSIIWNVLLSIVKITVGFLANSTAMVADGMHSVSDVFTTVLAFAGVKFAEKEADEEHPYGHEKIEPVMGKLLATVLFLTGVFIAYEAIQKIQAGQLVVPGQLAIGAAVLSIVVKEILFRYTIKGAEAISSSALRADAWHHRSDALSSVGSLVGIVGARLGYPLLDPIASVAISMLIIKVAFDIYMNSVRALIDTAASQPVIDKIEEITKSVPGVVRIDALRTRQHADRLYVDLEIAVDAELSLKKAHAIAEEVHDHLEKGMDRVKHVMVHVNPA
jgi:cation diffusion facilitator family transporter